MQTFRKLPITSPKSSAEARITEGICHTRRGASTPPAPAVPDS